MEKNPVFGTVFHNRTYLPPTPDYIEKREEESNFAFGQEKDSDPPHKTEKKSRVNAAIAVLAIAFILTLALALASTALAVLNYSESHALKQEMETLRTNQTTTVTRGIICQTVQAPENGHVTMATGTNLLTLGLGSVANYSCNTGLGLVGQTTRVCEDTNGGTVTTGTWSGSAPTCEEIFCSESPAPQNGTMSIATASNENRYSLGSVARYSCNTGFALVGQTTRVCEDTNGGAVTTGTWSGSLPTCEEILCSETPALGNGRVSITPNSDSPYFGLGSVAAYSCNTGFVLVGQTTRVCEDTNGGTVTTGAWSGSAPTCQEITCTELTTLGNGTISTDTGSDSLVLGLGSVATYTCNVGFVLVGQTTRVCEDTNGGTVTTGTWGGSPPACEEIFCSESPAPQNGTMSIATASNENRYSLGSVARYSCNTGFALVGQTTRVCENTNGGIVTTGTWNGSLPTCEEILCSETPALGNGRVSITPNSDSSYYGLGSVAAYSCNTGFVLVGQTNRVCEDTNGGTVTTGAWSGSAPTCQEITCTELTTLGNGTISTDTGSDSLVLGLGSIATYTCNTGFGLVGQTTRVCEDTNGGTVTTGTWSGSAPTCEEILCPELPVLANGTLTIEPGNSSTTLRLGFTATYSCNTGFGLVGQTTRVCQDTNGGAVTTGTWSGSPPTCEEILCQELPVLANGTFTIEPGNSSMTIGLEFTAAYSCNTGFVLVGQTTRVCEDTNGGTVGNGIWSGSAPTCEEILCPELLAPGGGTIMIGGGINLLPYSLGSVATYSCNTGYVLVGQTTRVCQDTNGGTWSERAPTCEVTCSALTDLRNGIIRIVPNSITQRSSLGSIATYSCNTVFGLIGQTTRVCQEITEGTVTTGTWSGSAPTCVATTVIDCHQTDCRSEKLTCPERSPCVINCEDSRRYACYQTAFTCSAGGGDSTVNCDDSYACFQANMTCPEGGNCLFNCDSPHSCQHTAIACSPGDGQCIVDCDNIEACRYANITCPEGGNCTVNCGQSYYGNNYNCRDSIIECKDSAQCTVNCDTQGYNYWDCYNTSIICSGEGGDCSMNCNGRYVCWYANIACPKGKDCTMDCEGLRPCEGANFICPQGENCTMNCTGQSACQYANFICPESENCAITCNEQYSCRYSNFRCPEGANCTVNCNGQFGCDRATVTCPTGDYSCNIHCTDPLSCANLRIINTNNVNLHCCGDFSCAGVNVPLTSMVCPFID